MTSAITTPAPKSDKMNKINICFPRENVSKIKYSATLRSTASASVIK